MYEYLNNYNEQINKAIQSKLLLKIETESRELDKLKLLVKQCDERISINNEMFKIIKMLERKKLDYQEVANAWKICNDNELTKERIETLVKALNAIYEEINKNEKLRKELLYPLNKVISFFNNNIDFLTTNIVVVNGYGATGKTHVLTKLNNTLLNQNQPSIILYAHKFCSIDDIVKSLNDYFDTEDFFNDFGTKQNTTNMTPILIFDALNEYNGNDVLELIDFLNNKSLENNIKVIISYRTEDLNEVIIEKLNKFPSLSMFGFEDEIHASIKFAEHYEIDINELLALDFNNNPLMMKIYCELYHLKVKEKGERGSKTATYYLEQYFKEISRKLIREKSIKYKNKKEVNHNAFWNYIAKELAKYMVKNNIAYIPENKVIDIIDNLNLNVDSYSLLLWFTSYNLFERYLYDYKNSLYAFRFTFQRFSDFLITRYMLLEKKESETWRNFLNKQDRIKYFNKHRTILATFVEEIPKRTRGKELYEFIDFKKHSNFLDIYIHGLNYRSNKSFEHSHYFVREFFKFIQENQFDINDQTFINMLFSVMLIEYHPFNFMNYTKNYIRELIDERKEVRYHELFDQLSGRRQRILSLLKIPYYSNVKKIKIGTTKNLALLYFYLLGLSDRELRDKGSKGLLILLENNPYLLKGLYLEAIGIDDQYIIERFLIILDGLMSIIKLSVELQEGLKNFLIHEFKNKEISNIRIKYYLDKLIYKTKMTKNGKWNFYKHKELSIINKFPEEYEKEIKMGLESSHVFFSLSVFMGDFFKYVVSPTINSFEYKMSKDEYYDVEKKILSKMIKEDKEIINNIFKKSDKYKPNSFKEIMHSNFWDVKKDLLSQLSKESKEIFDYYERLRKSYKAKKLSEDQIISTLIIKMKNLGFNKEMENYDFKMVRLSPSHSRNYHKIERIGKKYQWIAFFEFLGECFYSLEAKGYKDYIDMIDYDIDVLQRRNNEKETYEFHHVFEKFKNKIKIDWHAEDFVSNYDNIELFDNFKLLTYKGENYIPLYLFVEYDNEFKNRKVSFRIYSFDVNKENENKISNQKNDYFSTYNSYVTVHNQSMESVLRGFDEKRYHEDEPLFNNLVKRLYLENPYDHSNIDITFDDKNRNYYFPRHYFTENLTYNYSGIFYGDNDKVAIIQSPFDSNDSYLFVREDVVNNHSCKLLFGVYSEKQHWGKSKSMHEFSSGSEYDSLYLYEKKIEIMKNIFKREASKITN